MEKDRCYASLDHTSLSIVERLTRATTTEKRQENRAYIRHSDNPSSSYYEATIAVDWRTTKSVQWSFQASKPVSFQICTACVKDGGGGGGGGGTGCSTAPLFIRRREHQDLSAPLEGSTVLNEVAMRDSGRIDWPAQKPRQTGLIALRWMLVNDEQQVRVYPVCCLLFTV